MKQWLLSIVLTAFAGGLARQLAPRGREQAAVRLVGGLLLILVMLRPLGELKWTWTLPGAQALREDAARQAASWRKDGQDALSAIIAEKTGAYIWDKANQLGLECSVQVTTAAGESGIPLPDTVTIRGPYSQELADCIQEEVGIPAEKMIWLEETTWTETTKSERG